MMRAAIYARFSSDNQNERSCEDQIRYCTAWAERHDLAIIETFRDEAVSGASAINRFGLAKMMRAARERRFEVLVCEDLDRIARKQADLHAIRDELTFLGIRIMTVADGTVTAMHAGLKGLMGEMFLADLANKTRRGLSARVQAGASGGGRSYGYDPVPGCPGEMTINEREATIVRRILTAYADGITPRAIAAALNAERVPSPRGGKWNASTIHGSKSRQNGVLANRLYIGEIVWNRQRFIKDPSTGKRVSRPNPPSEWQVAEVSELAIVDRDLFDRVQARRAERTFDKPSDPVRAKPRHLLSGILKCGCCGASYTIIGRDRLGCAGYRERGDCSNNRTLTRREVEVRVLDALQTNLADPELMGEYVRAYHEERRRLAEGNRQALHAQRRRLTELERGITRIVDMIVDGTAGKALAAKLVEMEAEQEQLQAEIAAGTAEENAIALHPAAAEHYRRITADLQRHVENMRAGHPSYKLLEEARRLIDKVVIIPKGEKKPVDLEVHGRLAELLMPSDGKPPCRGAMVAGARNHRSPTWRIVA